MGIRVGDDHPSDFGIAALEQRIAVGVLHQAADDVVEQCNLIAAVEFGAAEEQIDDPAQGRAALEIRRLAERHVEFSKERLRGQRHLNSRWLEFAINAEPAGMLAALRRT